MKKYTTLGLLIILTACVPLTHTEYQLIPPRTAGGQACAVQCQINRSQCQEIEDMKAERCQAHSDHDQHRCEERIRREKHRDPKWYECVEDGCDVDLERCESNYRSCFAACGGEVRPIIVNGL